MDFDLHFSREDEEFRKEVRAFLEKNIPPGFEFPVEPYEITTEHAKVKRDIDRRLGARGWFAPDYPKEYGGGGLSDERVAVLLQEFNRTGQPVGYGRFLRSITGTMAEPLLKYGPEELKREILPQIFTRTNHLVPTNVCF